MASSNQKRRKAALKVLREAREEGYRPLKTRRRGRRLRRNPSNSTAFKLALLAGVGFGVFNAFVLTVVPVGQTRTTRFLAAGAPSGLLTYLLARG